MKRISFLVLAAAAACGRPAPEVDMKTQPAAKESAHATEKDPARLTEAEWKQRLTPEQYRVCRQKGTEPAGSGEYDRHFEPGTYACVACGAPLFSSETKYDSGCGWPAYWDALSGAVRQESGLEVVCAKCGSHLGHVFDDGPLPTGKRY